MSLAGSSKGQSSDSGLRTMRPKDFAELFGIPRNDLPEDCIRLIHDGDFRYSELHGGERDGVILSILKKIASAELTVAGDEGARARWEKGWAENLRKTSRKDFNLSALAPKYIRKNQAVRLNQNYVMPNDPDLEFNWYRIFTLWLFRKYFKDVDAVYEFGCGSGINVAALAKLYPDKKIVGLDWAPSSKKIIDRLAKVYRWNVEGRLFDFFNPDASTKLIRRSAVLTVGALEQTGQRYEAFLRYLLRASPSICVNIEPICEWYDENNIMDYLAIMFHKRRGYWEKFPDRLKTLQKQWNAEFLNMKSSYFGSLFIEE